MKIKSDTDLHVSTTWGAAIFLKAGEEREVGDDLGYPALQQGAVEAKEAPAPKKRGRSAKKEAADDSNTPESEESQVDRAEAE